MSQFEAQHVHKFYKESSKEFSATRYRMWTKVEYFYNKYVGPTDVILDVGSGNGRNVLYPDRTVCIDYSRELLEIARDSNKKVCVNNKTEQDSTSYNSIQHKYTLSTYLRHDIAESLPVKNESIDAAISIAVIHHLSTEERRKKAVHNILSTMKVSGYCLIYVWSETPESKPTKFQGITNVKQEDLTKPPTNTTANDVFVGWKKTNKLDRYYHLFANKELESLIPTEQARVIESGKEYGNYFVICQKTFS